MGTNFLLAALLPFAQTPDASARETLLATERALAIWVDEKRAQARVRELVALGPRMGGTQSGRRASEWLAERFRESGLDTRVLVDRERWCHEESAWSVSARAAGESEAFVLARAWPYGFSPSSKGRANLAIDGALGAVWLAERSPRNLKEVRPLLVLVDGSTTLDGTWPVVHHLKAGDQNPCAIFGVSRDEGARLRGWLAEKRAVEIEWSLETVIRESAARTVVARLPGRASVEAWKDDYLLFCAHGDSDAGGPGADDNASGEATLLEIAAAWKRGIDQGLVAPPAREVRFAIWGSEISSTRHYLQTHVPGQGRLLGVINYDQAGFGSGLDQLNVEPDDVSANLGLVSVVVEVLRDHEGAPGFPKCWATNKSLGGTDSYVFSESELFRREKLPAVTLFTSAWGTPGRHPRTADQPGDRCQPGDEVRVDYDNYYHSAGDTPENTTDKEPWNMGWCARIGLLSARRFLERSP